LAWGLKVAVQGWLAYTAHRHAGLPLPWRWLWAVEGDTLALTISLVGFQFASREVVWKGRRYQ
jgi:hypothetical protein